MEAKELMIGDWVYNKNIDKPMQVYPMMFSQMFRQRPDATTEDYNIFPIPLTPEILEKNGFIKHDKWNEWIHYTNLIFIDFTLLVDEDGFHLDIPNARINYVHELQHALRLCGIEKEIEL